jgi:hypothetical protein
MQLKIYFMKSLVIMLDDFYRKKTVLVIFLVSIFFFNKSVFSQHLSYNDILTLYKSNSEENETFLSKKGFTFSKSEKDDATNKTSITWMYRRPGVNNSSSNEYIIKDCSNLFQGDCESITYYTASEVHFNILKNTMKAKFYKFIYSDTNEYGVLSHHYLIPAAGLPGPTEAIFKTIPKTENLPSKVFVLIFRKVKVEVKDGN